MRFAVRAMSLAAATAVVVTGHAHAQSRDQISIVGSSTVYPFATAVAEKFANLTGNPTPVVESTGSGGGMKLFCAGVGTEHPDITNASRRMKPSEFEMCDAAGVTEIVEVKIGYDGIVVASAANAPEFDLTRAQLFRALAKGQGEPAKWSDIDPSLPNVGIEVLGPPPTSGTRDAFEELALEEGCLEAGEPEEVCGAIEIRSDGAWVDAGENDNLIVSKLEANPDALGVFGYSFLEQNQGRIRGAQIGGVDPTFDTIAEGDYPLGRSLYFYLKKPHVGVVPGLQEYAGEFVSDDATGEFGYLTDRGLIPLPEEEHQAQQDVVENLTALSGEDL